jgi:hypothetical protein
MGKDGPAIRARVRGACAGAVRKSRRDRTDGGWRGPRKTVRASRGRDLRGAMGEGLRVDVRRSSGHRVDPLCQPRDTSRDAIYRCSPVTSFTPRRSL